MATQLTKPRQELTLRYVDEVLKELSEAAKAERREDVATVLVRAMIYAHRAKLAVRVGAEDVAYTNMCYMALLLEGAPD
jgi:hypothetical protein